LFPVFLAAENILDILCVHQLSVQKMYMFEQVIDVLFILQIFRCIVCVKRSKFMIATDCVKYIYIAPIIAQSECISNKIYALIYKLCIDSLAYRR